MNRYLIFLLLSITHSMIQSSLENYYGPKLQMLITEEETARNHLRAIENNRFADIPDEIFAQPIDNIRSTCHNRVQRYKTIYELIQYCKVDINVPAPYCFSILSQIIRAIGQSIDYDHEKLTPDDQEFLSTLCNQHGADPEKCLAQVTPIACKSSNPNQKIFMQHLSTAPFFRRQSRADKQNNA